MIKKIYEVFKNKDWFDNADIEHKGGRDCFALLNEERKVDQFSAFYQMNGEDLQLILADLLISRSLEGGFTPKEYKEYKQGASDVVAFFYKSFIESEKELAKAKKT